MGYGKVAPAPVRSTDCARATGESRAAADKATAMLRTVLITCDSVKEVCRAANSPGYVTGHHIARKGFVTTALSARYGGVPLYVTVPPSGKKILMVVPAPNTLSAFTVPP